MELRDYKNLIFYAFENLYSRLCTEIFFYFKLVSRNYSPVISTLRVFEGRQIEDPNHGKWIGSSKASMSPWHINGLSLCHRGTELNS